MPKAATTTGEREDTTVRVETAALRASVYPDRLEDVLASLKFRRLVRSFVVDVDGADTVTKVTLDAARGMALLEMIGLTGRERA